MPVNYDDDDGEEQTNTSGVRTVIRSGWAGAEQTAASVSSEEYSERLVVGADPIVIKFLQDHPYASWARHWVERAGKKSYTCLGDSSCPLCNIGNKPRPMHAFNVVLMERGEEPVVRSYEVGSRVLGSLKTFNADERQGPLDKHYWAVSKSGQRAKTQYNHHLIKERDLDEDWSLTPLDRSVLEVLEDNMYTSDIIESAVFDQLLEISQEG